MELKYQWQTHYFAWIEGCPRQIQGLSCPLDHKGSTVGGHDPCGNCLDQSERTGEDKHICERWIQRERKTEQHLRTKCKTEQNLQINDKTDKGIPIENRKGFKKWKMRLLYNKIHLGIHQTICNSSIHQFDNYCLIQTNYILGGKFWEEA